jgi:hypothetical protein
LVYFVQFIATTVTRKLSNCLLCVFVRRFRCSLECADTVRATYGLHSLHLNYAVL